MYGWIDDSRFYVLFNSISAISGRWADDNEGLCAMEPRLRLRRFRQVFSIMYFVWSPEGDIFFYCFLNNYCYFSLDYIKLSVQNKRTSLILSLVSFYVLKKSVKVAPVLNLNRLSYECQNVMY